MLWLNVALALVIMYVLYTTTKNAGDWTVYGTNGCGWTRKQIDHMEKNGISYEYVECDKEDCGDITAFPTMKNSNGEVIEGFREI